MAVFCKPDWFCSEEDDELQLVLAYSLQEFAVFWAFSSLDIPFENSEHKTIIHRIKQTSFFTIRTSLLCVVLTRKLVVILLNSQYVFVSRSSPFLYFLTDHLYKSREPELTGWTKAMVMVNIISFIVLTVCWGKKSLRQTTTKSNELIRKQKGENVCLVVTGTLCVAVLWWRGLAVVRFNADKDCELKSERTQRLMHGAADDGEECDTRSMKAMPALI